jgi:hypothetical protein
MGGKPPTKPTKPPPTGPHWAELSSQRWGPSLDHAEPPIDRPRNWRSEVAAWPHERWVAWRARSSELLAALARARPPTAEDIRDADHRAYLEDVLRVD